MPIYEYELPSGQKVQVDSPDRAKADVAFKEWQNTNTSVEEFEPTLTPAQWLGDQYNSALSGFLKYGVAGLASLPGTVERAATFLPGGQRTGGIDYSSLAPETFGRSETNRFLFPSYEQTLASLEKIPGVERFTQYQPKSRAGEYTETISGLDTLVDVSFSCCCGIFGAYDEFRVQCIVLSVPSAFVNTTVQTPLCNSSTIFSWLCVIYFSFLFLL